MPRLTLDVPEPLARGLNPDDLARHTLEALAISAYQARRLSAYEARLALGLSSRFEFDELLKRHGVVDYAVGDFEQDWDTVRRLQSRRVVNAQPAE